MKTICILFILLIAVQSEGFFEKFYPLADEIISHMTLDQKLGQMIQADFSQFNHRDDTTQYEQIEEYLLGSVLIGGNGCPDGQGNVKISDDYSHATNEEWSKVAEKAMSYVIKVETEEGPVGIKLLLGTDAVHGNQHSVGTILFPHNIGLAASHNPEHFAKAGYWNKVGVSKAGFNYAFAPTVAVSHSYQWGRFYETMGDDPALISKYAKAYVNQIQDIQGDYLEGVLSSTKHFLGDGATYNGNDEGNVKVYDYTTFLEHNLQGYVGAIEENTGTIMVSYSAINEHLMSLNGELINGLLKQKMGFGGFLISDYDAIGKASYQGYPSTGVKMALKEAYLMSLSAGMDMVMLAPFKEDEVYKFLDVAKELLEEGSLKMTRIDDAVKRILGVKLSMQLVEVPESLAQKYGYKNKTEKPQVEFDHEEEYKDALKAAQESFVLLENENEVLPLNKDKIDYVVLVGERTINDVTYQDFDNIGLQNGGWSVRWQGYEGNQYQDGEYKDQNNAQSILDSLNIAYHDHMTILKAEYDVTSDQTHVQTQREKFLVELRDMLPNMNAGNSVIVGVIGESPYSEFMGDINNKFCWGTPDWVEGCIYNSHANEYLPLQQKTTLDIDYDAFSKAVMQVVKEQDAGIPVVTILFSGRPMLIQEVLNVSDAFVAAWLPGTAGGEAVVNSLFGNYLFRADAKNDRVNSLPTDWFVSMEDLKNFPVYEGFGVPKIPNTLFKSGFGLSTKKSTTVIVE